MTAPRPFVIVLQPPLGTDGIRGLRRVLKYALRECGLRATECYPLFDAVADDVPAVLAQFANEFHCNDNAAAENAREAARRTLRSGLALSAKERNFLNEATGLNTFSPRQRDWLRALYDRSRPPARNNNEKARP